MAKQVVGSMSDWSGVLKDFFRQIDNGSHTLETLRAFNEHRNPFEIVHRTSKWADEIVAQARRKLKKFFGRYVQVDPVPSSWTQEFLENAAKYNLRPVFLPETDISESFQHGGYVKPEAWYYNNVKSGNIKGKAPTKLRKGWYLADFSMGTDYTDGTQVFANDPLAPVIERLRREKKIGKYDLTPLGSRFSITNDEWRETVCPAVARELGVRPEQVGLERAIEFNAIRNLYDPNRGKFNMWEWFSDVFGASGRVCGGGREGGGLADVYYGSAGPRRDYIAGRPLVSFQLLVS